MRKIGKLELKSDYVIKGKRMEGVRKIGSPIEIAKKFIDLDIDELFFIDTVASLYDRSVSPEIIKNITENIFVPVCAGGGIRSEKDANSLFLSGADKVSGSTLFYNNLNVAKKIIDTYGSQAMVAQLEARIINRKINLFCEWGREPIQIDVEDYVKNLIKIGIGEVHIISIEDDGIFNGPNNQIIEWCLENFKVPVVYSGGIKSFDEMKLIEKEYPELSGVAFASMVYYND
ncbi:HisA/HisF-related TIM barrel protein [Alphaproteobacteria bacterium]|nr:HisA/HisF-related TIM barrel protein [Alphaproteobacteria bacterium]